MANWAPKRDFETIRQMTLALQDDRSPILKRMLEVQREYDADIVVPLPDLKNEPDMPNLTPQMMTDVIDNLAMRAASQRPMVHSPAIDPTLVEGPGSVGYAKDRVRIINATYHNSGWLLGRRRALRHLNAFETESLVIEPDFELGIPKIRIRNPLETFPEARAVENQDPPEHVAFITRYSGAALRARFPMVAAENSGPIAAIATTQLWDVFEWQDSDQSRYGLLGPVLLQGEHVNNEYRQYNGPWMPLGDPVRNRAGRCLAVTPQAVSLHTIGNRLNRLIANVRWQNRLMALDILAQEKAIFPDMYIMGGRSGQHPTLAEGTWQDGRTGRMNLIGGADKIGLLNQQPDVRTSQVIDRLEFGFRSTSGNSPMFDGQSSGSSLRTGRALGKMAEISIDPRIQEIHELEEQWMPHVNRAVLDTYKAWWPTKKYVMFSGWPSDTGQLGFTPNETIETSDNVVTFAMAGADINQLTQRLGSLHGSEIMSTETVQRLHPDIAEPHDEQVRIVKDKLDRATLDGIAQQVITGQMPMAVYARIRERYNDGMLRLEQAIVEIDNEIREEQLAAQQAAAQQQPAVDPGINAVPGLAAGPQAAAPGAAPPGLPAAMPAPGGDVAAMRQLLTQGA